MSTTPSKGSRNRHASHEGTHSRVRGHDSETFANRWLHNVHQRVSNGHLLEHRRPAPVGRPRVVDLAAALVGIGLGATLSLAVVSTSSGALQSAGGWVTEIGRVFGFVGAYGLLISVLLAGRIPVIERTLGQDELMRWHSLISPWALGLIFVHGTLITIGYSEAVHTGVLTQFGHLITGYPGVITGTAGFLLLLMAGITSWRIARRRMKYETWWAVHLYTYLALALAFSHQIATGIPFIGHPVARAFWTALWIATAGVVFVYRILLPVWRSLFHQMRVISVEREQPDVVSITLEGRRIDRMPLSGGQFCQLRILKRGQWWQAHPYSVSALPTDSHVRFTVKDVGDHSGSLANLEVGTRVAIEGPYGAFTADARQTDRVLLIGAGVGITPLRSLLEDLPDHVDTVMLTRSPTEDGLLLGDELRTLLEARGGSLHELIGPRRRVSLDPHALQQLIPDIHRRDLFICGPPGFTTTMRRAAEALGVPKNRVHHEEFAF